MEYSALFSSEDLHIDGVLNIDYKKDDTNTGQYVESSIEINAIDSQINQRYRLNAKHGVTLSQSIIDMTGEKVHKDMKIYLPPDVSKIDITIEADIDGQKSKGVRFGFNDLSVLHLSNDLLNIDNFDKYTFQRNVISNYGDGNIWPLFNFIGESAEYTDYDTYIQMVERILNEYPQAVNKVSKTLTTILKRLILGKVGDGRHKIQTFAELEIAIEDLKNVHEFADINPERSIRYALRELDKNEDINELIAVLYDLQVVDTFSESLNDKVFNILLSEEIKRRSVSGVENLTESYFDTERNSESEDETFESKKQDAIESKEADVYKDWYDLLSYLNVESSENDVKFIVSNYLFNIGLAKQDDPEYYYITHRFFEAAEIWGKDLDLPLVQRSVYQKFYTKGLYFYHRQKFNQSSDNLLNAIRTATNANGEYDTHKDSWLSFPIIYKSLSDARALTKQNRYQEAIDLLKNRGKVFEGFSPFTERQSKKVVSAIIGERLRILSDIYLRNKEYERAKETLGKSIGELKSGGLNRAAESVIQKKIEVEVLLKEINGDFQEAARDHKRLSKEGNYSKSKQTIHYVRSEVCYAKSFTIARDYDKAREKIMQVNRKTNKLKYEAKDLGILLSILTDYENKNITNAGRALKKLTTQNSDSVLNHILDLDYDYSESIVVILALQRLRQTELPPDLLESFIEISLNLAFVPSQSSEVIDETHLGDISIDRLWRERLPSLVLNRIEEISIEKETVMGNYKSVMLLLSELLEFYLALLVEYHGKRYWRADWRQELTNEGESVENLSIGVLSRIFTSEAASGITNSENLKELYFSDINKFSNMTQMRNKYSHGYEGHVEKATFEAIQERVFEFLRVSVQDAPLIISVKHENLMDLYPIQIHWWRGLRNILIKTDMQLEAGSYYYVPVDQIPSSTNNVIYPIDGEHIIKIQDNRIIDQLENID